MKLKVIFLAGLFCAFSTIAEEIKTENMSEDELVAAAERLIAQEDTPKEVIEKKPATKAEVKEDEIPAFRGTEKTAESSSSPWMRLILGAGIVMTLALGMLFGAKRFSKRNISLNGKVTLDIVTQKAISPKQNLLVVRIAGEHILIGATDHSINMIKSVSLIDDEADQALPQDFNNFLEDDFVEQSISSPKKQRTFTL